MTALQEIKRQAQKQFPAFIKYITEGLNGALVQNKRMFPMPVRVNFSKEAEDPKQKSELLAEIYEHSKNVTGSGYSLEIELINTRSKGDRKVLKRICFNTEDDYLAFLIGGGTEVKQGYETEGFNEAIFAIIQSGLFEEDALADWALKHIVQLGYCYDDPRFWQKACAVAAWLTDNPSSNLYIRQIPLSPSISSKFIEDNKNIIHSLITREPIKISFEADHGLLGKQTTVRFRSLCKEVSLKLGSIAPKELTLSIEDFCTFSKSGLISKLKNIFIVENEMVYLTFPEYKNSICILAQGYSANVLKLCDWLKDFELYYFGSCNENSFDVLSSLRSFFEKIKSFCMNKTVIEDHSQYLQKGAVLHSQSIPNDLTYEENQTFLLLRDNPLKNELDQENISIEYIQKALEQLPLSR